MSRVLSLLPSATEIVCALGEGYRLVGRSHECDFPPFVKTLPVASEARVGMPQAFEDSATIDAEVWRLVREALAIYRVDEEALRTMRPDVILTQTLCDVCAVSLKDVEAAVARVLDGAATIVALAPLDLDDVFADIARVAAALGVAQRGAVLVDDLRARMAAVEAAVRGRARPRVACIEWLSPLMGAGNWMPTLIEKAGGVPVFGTAGQHSPYITLDELRAAEADVIVLVPCGFDLPRTERDVHLVTALDGWHDLRAVRAGRVFLADGNQYFNRPGPRLVESLEILAEIVSDGAVRFGHEDHGYRRHGRMPPASGHGGRGVTHGKGPSMATESIRISAVIPAAPEELYAAWLNGEKHGELTGGAASVEARVGGRHTAWDGYIEGQILELEPSRRIVQSWRSLDFPQDSPDSKLEILFAAAPGGAEITLVHTEIPEGQGADYEEGWVEHYFKPMQRHFGRPASNGVATDAVTEFDAPETTQVSPPAAPAPSPVAKKAKAAPAKKAKAAPAKKTKARAAKKAKKKPVAVKKATVSKKKPAVAKKKPAKAKKPATKKKAAPAKKAKKPAPKAKAKAKKRSAKKR